MSPADFIDWSLSIIFVAGVAAFVVFLLLMAGRYVKESLR